VREQIQVGSKAVVRLYDGHEVEATITAIGPTGQKVHIAFGVFALKVDAAKIIRMVKE
jgi:hypothetical protein